MAIARGPLPGADNDRPGLLLDAQGGTFAFDEIHDLDPLLQGKLLRVLQENEVRPLGATKAVRLNVRFIAATNQDPGRLVAQKRFREDLFYRLNVVPIRMPSLVDRLEDLPLLARYFLDLHARTDEREPLKVRPDVWRRLQLKKWPGNVRELENFCRRAIALADSDTFDGNLMSLVEDLDSSHAPVGGRLAAPARDDYRSARLSIDRQLIEQSLVDHRATSRRRPRRWASAARRFTKNCIGSA